MALLSLSDKALFEEYRNELQIQNWVYNWEYLYSISSIKNIAYKIIDGSLCFFTKTRGRITMFYPPLGKENNLVNTIINDLKINKVNHVYQGYESNNLTNRPNDFIFKLEDLIKLKGHSYKNVRNMITKFKRENDYVWREANLNDIPEIRELFDLWYQSQGNKYYIVWDKKATIKGMEYAINNIPSYVTIIDDKIKGFVCGNKSIDDWSYCFIRKTDVSIKGLSDFVFVEFYKEMFDKGFKFGNDGIACSKNLKAYKLKFQPIRIVKNYSLEVN